MVKGITHKILHRKRKTNTKKAFVPSGNEVGWPKTRKITKKNNGNVGPVGSKNEAKVNGRPLSGDVSDEGKPGWRHLVHGGVKRGVKKSDSFPKGPEHCACVNVCRRLQSERRKLFEARG